MISFSFSTLIFKEKNRLRDNKINIYKGHETTKIEKKGRDKKKEKKK